MILHHWFQLDSGNPKFWINWIYSGDHKYCQKCRWNPVDNIWGEGIVYYPHYTFLHHLQSPFSIPAAVPEFRSVNKTPISDDVSSRESTILIIFFLLCRNIDDYDHPVPFWSSFNKLIFIKAYVNTWWTFDRFLLQVSGGNYLLSIWWVFRTLEFCGNYLLGFSAQHNICYGIVR